MKVLLVNKFHWMKGGSETYYFELGKLLEEHGHEVAYFSMENEKMHFNYLLLNGSLKYVFRS